MQNLSLEMAKKKSNGRPGRKFTDMGPSRKLSSNVCHKRHISWARDLTEVNVFDTDSTKEVPKSCASIESSDKQIKGILKGGKGCTSRHSSDNVVKFTQEERKSSKARGSKKSKFCAEKSDPMGNQRKSSSNSLLNGCKFSLGFVSVFKQKLGILSLNWPNIWKS